MQNMMCLPKCASHVGVRIDFTKVRLRGIIVNKFRSLLDLKI